MAPLVESGFLLSGGGHSMAAGLKSMENQLVKSMTELKNNLSSQNSYNELPSELEIDCLISNKGASISLVNEINSVGPFGTNNPHPIVAIANCQIKYAKILVDKHIKFVCVDSTNTKLESIFFNGVDTKSGQKILNNRGKG